MNFKYFPPEPTPAPTKPNLREVLSRRRKDVGLRPEALAKACGVDNRVLSRWRSGQEVPTPAQLSALLDALGLRSDQLDASELEAPPPNPSELAGQYAATVLNQALGQDAVSKLAAIAPEVHSELVLTARGFYWSECPIEMASEILRGQNRASAEKVIAEHEAKVAADAAAVDAEKAVETRTSTPVEVTASPNVETDSAEVASANEPVENLSPVTPAE